MSLLASTINGAGYVLTNGEDKDVGNGFEFTRRKRWPQLLMQELVGSALFCIKPVVKPSTSGDAGGVQYTWKIMFVSPSVEEMIGQSPAALEGKDFLEIVHSPDRPQLKKFFVHLLAPNPSPQNSDSSTTTMTSLNTPSGPALPIGTSTKSETTFIRVETVPNTSKKASSKDSVPKKPGQVVWEVRAHATGVENPGEIEERTMQLGTGMNGTVSQVEGKNGVDLKGKAIWVMGRSTAEPTGESDGNAQSLDAFLELKLENEKLREELRELQQEYGEDDMPIPSYLDASPSRPSANLQTPSSSASDDEDDSSLDSSSPSSPDYANATKPSVAGKVGRPPKDPAAREKKKAKKAANAQTARVQATGVEGGEGMHVCVTCGRTDSPEWRKGPLGPKTLCNACGLRWAKRNSSAPTRKERKAK
ncbi:hypothetical protein BD324DRAFT_623763 [Kockovaella imperatae]|uniref:GATA-type domain-containing protein n=1 Tax=Kockovaella imperatae TaxID=4999 RepID=A0A1Y1UIM9_9TREE|nr:hypothetical protein BD324DRAFT_623763 [Kockovaella imperatae]ORX37908.1 hypothetical protein BD324DRAFT_623763 [Kockovaella imperatae]